MAKLDEGRIHLIISMILGALAALTVIGAVIAVRERLFGGGTAPAPSVPSQAVSQPSVMSEPEVPSQPEPPAASSQPAPSSQPSEPSSSTVSASSEEASSEDASSEEISSEDEAPAYDPEFPGVSVVLFADGQLQELTPEQTDVFMNLYLLVDIAYVRTEDNTDLNAVSTGGFSVTYPDGRSESYRIGEIYDGTWWSGNVFYEVDEHALSLEEYMYQFPIIQNWLNRAHAAGLIIS